MNHGLDMIRPLPGCVGWLERTMSSFKHKEGVTVALNIFKEHAQVYQTTVSECFYQYRNIIGYDVVSSSCTNTLLLTFKKFRKFLSPVLIGTGKTSMLWWYIFSPFILIPVTSSAFLLIGFFGRMNSLKVLPSLRAEICKICEVLAVKWIKEIRKYF